ncbi:MAG TPA: amidohydrolase, partial [Vicinamibacterales bacterium]|nr:amidohydrolase [Vicinamibacterales bacterium]
MKHLFSSIFLIVLVHGLFDRGARAQGSLAAEIDRRAEQMFEKVIRWRRDFHEHPELGNRETRTAKIVADHLRSLGMEVRTGVAHTGVVGVLRGGPSTSLGAGKPGKVVALRADMDALPVTEQVKLPFASKVRTSYNGQEVGVMHACGHDNHLAILMGVAEILAGMKDQLPGTVKFIFQPAEEGAPSGEEGGAALMVKEGAFDNPRPDAVFGLHVWGAGSVGRIGYRAGAAMASSDVLRIVVRGKQTHGAVPWGGVDPIVVASQIVLGLQTIASRQLDVTKTPSIITIGSIHGGVRYNIIPDEVQLDGTIRTFSSDVQQDMHRRITLTAESIAASAGATASVVITPLYPVMVNDPALTERMLPTLRRVAGTGMVSEQPLITASEDFSFFAQRAPGMFVFLGATRKGVDPATAPANHSPSFDVDEGVLPLGVRTLANLAA